MATRRARRRPPKRARKAQATKPATTGRCGATNHSEVPCDRPRGHAGPHLFELVKANADLRDQIADLRTPGIRERLVTGARRRCPLLIGADDPRLTNKLRCGLDAEHLGRCNAIITPDAPWFIAPCICPAPPPDPMCPQHGLVRHADRE